MTLDIYFAGSIRGGREYVERYQQVVDQLTQYGNVLTEHVADPELDEDGEDLPVDEIFERDVTYLDGADVLVADVSTPSLGVGYELGRAEPDTPILCLYHADSEHTLSAMVDGNTELHIVEYADTDEAVDGVQDFFASLE